LADSLQVTTFAAVLDFTRFMEGTTKCKRMLLSRTG